MRMKLISQDRALAETLIRSVLRPEDQLDVVEETTSGQQEVGRYEVIIASDRTAQAETRSALREQVINGRRDTKYIWLMSNPHQADQGNAELKECLADGWTVVPPGLSCGQVAERLGQLIYEQGVERSHMRNGLIHFAATTPNIGTTTAAYGTAAALSQLTGKRVGYLCLNLKSAKLHRYVGERDPAVTLDGLRSELKAGYVTPERLLRQCRRSRRFPTLHLLYGNMQREQADYYTTEEINVLLRAAKEAFDYCIVDTNAYWDNAATIGAMLSAGQRIMVTTPQSAHHQEDMDHWCHALVSLFGLSLSDFDLLIVQSHRDAAYSGKQIAKEVQMARIGELSRFAGLERYLEEGNLDELLQGGSVFSKEVYRFAQTVLTLHGEPRIYAANSRSSDRGWTKWFALGRRTSFAGRQS